MKRRLFFTFIFLPGIIGAAQVSPPEQEAVLKDLSGGLNMYQSSNRIPDNSAAYLQNFYTDIEPILVERNGYVKRDATQLGGIKPVYGLWSFTDTSGNDWIISYSSRTFYKNTIGNTPTAFGPTTTVDTIPDCAKNLGKIMCVNGTDTAWTFDGTSTAAVSGAPLGQLIEPWRTRFAIGNINGAKSTVRFSADGDETTWTLGGNPGDPFQVQIGGANDGEYIRCLHGAYLDTFIIGRKYDLWGMDGFAQDDAVTRNISDHVGCIESRSINENDGRLNWLSARGVEEMEGRTITLISEPIRNITDVIVKNTVNQRSNTQTSQIDWNAGTTIDSTLSTSISPGSVVLSSMAANAFVDTVSTDFAAGTLNSVSTSTVQDALTLSLGAESGKETCTPADNPNIAACIAPYYSMTQSFTPSSSFILTSVSLKLGSKTGSPGDYILYLKADSSTSPGTTLDSVAVPASGITTASAGTVNTYTFTGGVRLVSGTRYWLQLVPQGTCSVAGGNYVRVTQQFNTCTNTEYSSYDNNSLPVAGDQRYGFYRSVNGKTFASSGKFTSRTFDVGFTTNTWVWNWGTLVPTKNLPTGTALTYQTQTSSAATGPFDSLVPVADGAITTSTVRRYILYTASFTTTDASTSPMISDLTLNYGPFYSTGGVFVSQLLNIGSLISSWGPATISDIQSSGTINYQFGSTNTASVSAISNWTTITNGGIPSVSTNPYAAFRATFTALNGSVNLVLADFQTTWNEGGVIPSPVSTVYDRRYWLSFTTSTTSNPYLDTVAVWQRNRSWTLFKGINAGAFSIWRDYLYFGNSNSTGYVYKFDVGDNDDGADITSILKTKSYDLDMPYRDKAFRNSWVNFTANTSYSGSFSAYYDLDRLGNAFSLGTVGMNEGTGQLSIKLPFSFRNPVQGREIQYTIAKSGTGQRLKLHDIILKFSPKEEQ